MSWRGNEVCCAMQHIGTGIAFAGAGTEWQAGAMNANLLDDLRAASPQLSLLTEAADLEHYGRDWTRRWTPAPLAIALPTTVEEIVAIVRWARIHKVAVVPSGGRTGLSGGAVAANGELVLSLERMHKVLEFFWKGWKLAHPGMDEGRYIWNNKKSA